MGTVTKIDGSQQPVVPENDEQWRSYLVDLKGQAVESVKAYCIGIHEFKESCEAKGTGSTFSSKVTDWLGVSESYGRKLAAIGGSEVVRTANAQQLPESIETLYLLTSMEDEKFQDAIDSGAVNSKTTRAEVIEMKRPKPVQPATVIPTHTEDAVIIPRDDMPDGEVVDEGDAPSQEMYEYFRDDLIDTLGKIREQYPEHCTEVFDIANDELFDGEKVVIKKQAALDYLNQEVNKIFAKRETTVTDYINRVEKLLTKTQWKAIRGLDRTGISNPAYYWLLDMKETAEAAVAPLLRKDEQGVMRALASILLYLDSVTTNIVNDATEKKRTELIDAKKKHGDYLAAREEDQKRVMRCLHPDSAGSRTEKQRSDALVIFRKMCGKK